MPATAKATARKTNLVAKLYSELAADPELDHATQQRIYTYATQAGNQVLLASLAAHPALAPGLDAQLAHASQARVRATWLARPERTPEQIRAALATARSSAVRRTLAALPDLPDEVYETLAATDTATATAVLSNQDAPLSARRIAARTYGKQPYTSKTNAYTFERNLAMLFTEQLAVVPDLVAECSNIAIIGWALSVVELPLETAERLYTIVSETIDTAHPVAPSSSADYDISSAVASAGTGLMLQQCLPQARREAIYQHVRAWLLRFNSLRNNIDSAYAGTAGKTLAEPEDAIQLYIANASTVEELERAQTYALSSLNANHALTFVYNRNTSVAAVRTITTKINGSLAVRAARARRDNIEALAAIAVHSRTSFIATDDLLATTANATDAFIAVVAEYVRSRKRLDRKLGKSRYLTAATAGSLPLEFIALHGNTAARAAAAELLGEHLTSDEAWRAFEALSAGFHGSLRELLQACGYILA